MNKTKFYIIQVGIVLPGLHSWPTASLAGICGDIEGASNLMKSLKYIDRLDGTHNEYTITTDKTLAKTIVDTVNVEKAHNLAEWRVAVFKESYNQVSLIHKVHTDTDASFAFCEKLHSGKQ